MKAAITKSKFRSIYNKRKAKKELRMLDANKMFYAKRRKQNRKPETDPETNRY